jgi:3-oxoacyl-[acyl-carrier protein] reductase
MNILVTGSSNGIGMKTADRFLSAGHEVFGFDILPGKINNPQYHHFIVDVSNKEMFPYLPAIDILVNNAGVQNKNDIEVNLLGTMYVTKAYGLHKNIKSIVNVASASARTGAEFAEYAVSKGGVVTYTKHIAQEIAKWSNMQQHISWRCSYRFE